FRCFCVATTVPTTLAICMPQSAIPDPRSAIRDPQSAIRNPQYGLPEIPVIHDPDDSCVDRRLGRIERKARLFAADEEDLLADAGADRIPRNQRPPRRLAFGRQRLDDEQLEPDEHLVLPRRDDVPNHARDLHAGYSLTSTVSMMPTMAASTGQSFIPDAMRAELPLTTRTVSPTPASTVSTATR